jgi:hypothetical protein
MAASNAESSRMIKIALRPDTLNEKSRKFSQQPLREPVLLNSVPKCGSHLLRNIVRMFVPVEQQYNVQFIQQQIVKEHFGAFSDPRNFLSWGHLMFNDVTAVAVGRIRHILLVRDPYDWVMARARFFVSEEFGDFELLKEGTLSVDALLNMMILGLHVKAPPLATIFTYNALAWFGTGVYLVRYEELIRALKQLDSGEAEQFFTELLAACGIDRPDDWRERVVIGSDRKQSGTARENLTGVAFEFPNELPPLQKSFVDFVAPGLRGILGYS